MNSTKKINLFAFEAIFFLTVATWSATSQQQAHPGGADNPNYTWLAWLTPDSYSNGVWTNLIQGGGSAGNFTAQSATAPPKINSGYNFHPSLNFPAGNTYWLKSANSLTIADTDNITAIFVLKRSTVLDQYNYLLAFSSVSDATDGMGIGWRSHTWGGVATQDISWKWRNTDNTYHFTGKPVTEGIAVIDNAKDASAGGLTLYLNGENPTSSIKATPLEAISDQPIGIASEKNTGDPSWHYRGTLQEIILLKANGTNNRIEPVDLQKIHSYLAIKYGFTLNNSQDYINSAGQSVWDRAANTDYRNYITGIARDDASGLYQKQSKNRNAASLLTVFVGSSVAALNSSNGGQLPDGVYAIFGSNNGDINTVENLSSEIPVAPGSTLTVNYLKGLKYKAQLTGATTQKVKLKFDTGRMGGALPEYVVVSRTSAFLPDPYVTKVFPLSGSTAEIELTDGYDGNGYNFIAFGGHRIGATEGPGGVSANLKLWLRADDAASIVTELLAVNSANKLNGYPDAVANALVPAVSEWKDLERNQTYSYTDGGNANDHMRSVYQPSNYMTNYHPAVRFWSSSSNSSYLGNASVTMFGPGTNNNGKKYPTNGKHSAFFVVNNNFNTHEWIYAMMFGSATSSSYRGPGYGVARIGSSPSYNLVGRFRTSLEEGNGTKDLFKQGATSILGYHHWWPTFSNGSPSGTSSVKFRFNGLEDTRTSISDGLIGMNQGSMLGKGYTDNRTILGVMAEVILYDDGLPTDRLELIESYLALKYGVTLTPGTAAERFDYKFSDGGMLWNGTAGGTKWETWYNRVAAVIRDDASGLHNRQSHSTNVGSILLMGVAGSRLGENNADLGNFANDREAVIWGDNGKNDNPVAIDLDPNGCGDFNHVFKRNWLIHKKTEGDRPIRMLVGAQNNSTNRLGNDAGTTNLFNKLTPGYSVYMIVADSAEKLDPDNPAKYGQFTAVVPMEFIDSVQQCSYTFTDTITYITFGYRPKQTSCTETVQFEGVKTFNWAQWVRQNYGLSVRGAGITKDTPVDLGDGIEVLSTNVTYSSDLTAPAWYPSVTNSPVAGSLYLQRKNGVLDDSKITVTINLNTPVRPEFSIYDIDGYYGRYEKITVSGSCNVGGVSPTLSYAGDPAAAYYEISGNMATATVRKNLSPTDKNGQLNVSFSEGVTQIVITYAITNQIQVTTTHNLIISPIRFRQVPPPPPINEDGLSFTKEVGQRDISTCEPVEYSFYLGNVNCESKPVTFRDTLPHGMKWTGEINWNLFDPIDLTKISYQGDTILQITDLDVPGADVLRVTATAVIDDGEVPPETTRQFNNHAWIEYVQILNDNPEPRILQSVDRETPTSQETWFNAIGGQRQDTVRSAITTNVSKYSADSTVTVTLTVTNPAGNDPVPSSYLDVTFDAGFEYIDGSFASNVTEAVIASSSGNGQLSIAGLADGSEGFEIPDGESTYTFELKAPALSGLVKEVDGSGVPTGEISPLQIEYIFTSGTTDPCVILGMIDVSGYCELPYKELIANHDHASTLTGIEVVIPVLKNDSIPATCTLEYEITTEPLHGDADFTNDSIRYQSDVDFAGYDTLVYRLVCDEDTSYAYVYIYVAEKPGNVTDVNCFIDLPAQVFTIRQNRYSDEIVANTSTPMVGDLLDADGNPGQDGVPEVIAMAYAGSYSGPGIHIFNNDLTLHHTINIDFTGLGLSDPYAIADVNNDSIGEILIASLSGDGYYLYAFTADGNQVWKSNASFFDMASLTHSPSSLNSPNIAIADIDHDGLVEILVGDRIFAGESGHLLVTLPATGDNGRGIGIQQPAHWGYFSIFGDVDGDGYMEAVGGRTTYTIRINDRDNPSLNTATALASMTGHIDGFCSVGDIDGDGILDVVVTEYNGRMYAWQGNRDEQIGQTVGTGTNLGSRPFIGDIDGDGWADIAFTSANRMAAYNYKPDTKQFGTLFDRATTDNSGRTTMCMFDFDQDGTAELVYRDKDYLMIIGPDGEVKKDADDNEARYPCDSGTSSENPIVVDFDGDGHADILVTGSLTPIEEAYQGRVIVYSSLIPGTWAPARKVWNQHGYNAVNINEDLSVPQYAIDPATLFPGKDGVLGTADDVRPFNSFLQQQTVLSADGTLFWPTPDAVADATISSYSVVTDNIVAVKVGIINRGDAALGPPVHVSLYRDALMPENYLNSNSDQTLMINRGDTGYVTVDVNMASDPVLKVVAKVNDDGSTYAFLPECKDDDDNTMGITLIKPLLSNDMTKSATLLLTPPVPGNGTYPNPVSILYGEEIEYRITAFNANLDSGTVIIRDTLPAYLRFVPGSENLSHPSPPFYSDFKRGTIPGPPERDTLMFRFDSLETLEPVWASFRATPASGVSASQPMFVNRAWITASDSLLIPTGTSTYHQGAGVSIVTFSAPAKGGDIYNATPQALDYRTSPNSGVLVVPDEGYAFAGWSHDAYTSLRGERIEARTGIKLYDTLTVYGNVELRAVFVAEEYPVRYYLHGGENPAANPPAYTVESAAVTLEAPNKPGDTFTGWTGSNGDEPQPSITIPRGSTGERNYYANYLHTGREEEAIREEERTETDRIWASGSEAFIRTSRPGSIARIYTPDGILREQRTLLSAGTAKIRLAPGVHIITLNNGPGQKIIIKL